MQEKWQQKKSNLAKYSQAYKEAVESYRQGDQELSRLEQANDVFLAHQEKQDEYLYLIDKETCDHYSVSQGQEKGGKLDFNNKTHLELTGNQTDAVRIWRNKVALENIHIHDNRNDIETAHRDGIQLIPPPEYETSKPDAKGVTKQIKLADQMVGTIPEGASIKNCSINAPNAALQGIFASDGMSRDLKINNVVIKTKGKHFISVAGALTGCEFKNITLHQLNEKYDAEIGLYPLRIGGNMADEGMISIIDFHPSSSVKYGDVVESGNHVVKLGEKRSTPLIITDKRDKIPP